MMQRKPVSHDKRRRLGAYYTPERATALMARWIMEHQPDSVLEPSFGDGSFLLAIEAEATTRSYLPQLVGAELDEDAYRSARARLGCSLDAHIGDFLTLSPRPVSAVIGNPPFVRLRHLDRTQRQAAREAARSALQEDMDPSGSVWMPFVLHATRFISHGGSMALVLPVEVTYVRYARPLWHYLSRSFGRLRVIRVFERLFDELLQDVVILLADDRGSKTQTVEFQVSQTLRSLEERTDTTTIDVSSILDGDRPFQYALLSPGIHDLVSNKLVSHTSSIGDLSKIRIGYVTGDKKFFHPTPLTIEQFELPNRSLHRCVASGRQLRGQGLFTDELAHCSTGYLWRPNDRALTDGERRYIRYGEATGVADRYKCSIREPWYVVPGVDIPDLIFSVFSDDPLLMLNSGGMVASNSMLCGNLTNGVSPGQMAVGWYSSIAQLYVELEIHSLGGGVLIAVPRELSRVRIPIIPRRTHTLTRLRSALTSPDQDTKIIADKMILEEGILSEDELGAVQAGVRTLQTWRRR